MVMYPLMYVPVLMLGLPNLPSKLWSARSGWRMAKAINEVLVRLCSKNANASMVWAASCDESTMRRGESRLSAHLYFVESYERKHTYFLAGLPVIEGTRQRGLEVGKRTSAGR